jgi:ATP-dependent helicase/nuclease subunit B
LIRIPIDLERVLRAGSTVVVPSRQRAHALHLAYAAAELDAGRRVWSTPDVLALDAWIMREVEARATAAAIVPRTLSRAEDWLLWRQCTADATREWDLVNRGALAEALRRASALAADNDIEIHPSAPGTEPALLYEVQRAVEERCKALDAQSLATATRALICSPDRSSPRAAGFLRISARLAALTGSRSAGRTSDVSAGRRAALRAPKKPRALIAPDDLTELELIAQWCQAQIERLPTARLLVVLPGNAGSRERLATLIQQTMEPSRWLAARHDAADGTTLDSLVAIEGGSPLARNPAVTHALATLSGLSGAALDFEDLSEWLRSPYWKKPDAPARARLDLWLRERGRMQLDLPTLAAELRAASVAAAAAQEIIGQIAQAAAALGEGRASPRDWSHRFRDALAVFGWPGERVRNSPDQQTVQRWHELLDEFGQLAAATGSAVPRATAVQWLAELAGRTPYESADPDPIVTLTPMLADPIVRYDGVWVAGLHSEVFPQPVQPDPYLPLPAQLAARIPAASAAGRLQEAQGLLAAWRASAQELVLSTPASSADLELLPSPLLGPWLARGRGKRRSEPAPAEPLWLPARARRPGWVEALDDRVGSAWDLQKPLPSGTRSLELQNTCPFRAYAELRLGSTELGAPEPGVDPKNRGKLLHAALQQFWRRVGNSEALRALAEPQLLELIENCVREATLSLWGGEQEPALLIRERRRTARLMRSLCELERHRPPFRVAATELEMPLSLQLKEPLSFAPARMNVRIDRIDELGSGGRAILDYKSGQHQTADWYGERPSHPQLLAYLAAVGPEVIAMATVNVTAREVRFDGIASSAQLLPKVRGVIGPQGSSADPGAAWELRRREWLEITERLAAGFVTGNAAVDPRQGACEYCHVKSVCRIGERAPPDQDLAEEALDE